MFIDSVTINVKAGNGGNGCVSLRHEKHVPRGGPDGGNGGRGGDVILLADSNLTTLMDLRYRHHNEADRGTHGKGKNMYGRKGEDLIIKVPLGTLIYDKATEELLCDMTEKEQKVVIAEGGAGGRGNMRFKSSTHQVPRSAEPGGEGQELDLNLELKLIADVGLVGKPNAGKSTLLSRLSAARPKIADYPFTTLEPNLGIIKMGDYDHFVMADIPGIIEGAHSGKGLGDEFLKHIERTRILLLLVDADADDYDEEFKMLENELAQYSPELALKPKLMYVTKTDLLNEEDRADVTYDSFSSVSGKGLDRFLATLGKLVIDER